MEDPLPRCAREIDCEGAIPFEGQVEIIRGRVSFDAMFLGAVFDHDLCSRAAGESVGMVAPDGLLVSEVPSVDVKAS